MVFWAYLPRKEASASLPMRHRRDLSGAIDSKSISRKSLRVAEHVREMSRSTSTSRDREDLEGALAGPPRQTFPPRLGTLHSALQHFAVFGAVQRPPFFDAGNRRRRIKLQQAGRSPFCFHDPTGKRVAC